MKKLLTIFITIAFSFVMFTACKNEEIEDFTAEPEEIVAPTQSDDELLHGYRPFINFASLDDYLNAYLAVKEDRGIEEFVRSGSPSRARETELATRETFYLPTQIPENYAIRRIEVRQNSYIVWYLPEDVIFTDGLNGDFWTAIYNNPHFAFSVFRQNSEDVFETQLREENKSVNDLIEGKYLFSQPNSFTWVHNGMLLTVAIPMKKNVPGSEYWEENNLTEKEILEWVRYTEIREINLTDTNEVRAVIEELSVERAERAARVEESAGDVGVGEARREEEP